MAYRNRTINPGLWDDEDFLELELPAQMLWIGLISHADDDGRLPAGPRSLRAKALRSHDFSVEQVCLWRDELVRRGMVCLYEVDGSSFLHLPHWRRYQYVNRPVPSVIPPCPHCEAALPTASGAVESRGLSGQAGQSAAPVAPEAIALVGPVSQTVDNERSTVSGAAVREAGMSAPLVASGYEQPYRLAERRQQSPTQLPRTESNATTSQRSRRRRRRHRSPLCSPPAPPIHPEWRVGQATPGALALPRPDVVATSGAEQATTPPIETALSALNSAIRSERDMDQMASEQSPLSSSPTPTSLARHIARDIEELSAGGTDEGALALLSTWSHGKDEASILVAWEACLDLSAEGIDWQYAMRKALLKPSHSVAYLVATARGRAGDLLQQASPPAAYRSPQQESYTAVPVEMAIASPGSAVYSRGMAADAGSELEGRRIVNKYTSGKYGHLVH